MVKPSRIHESGGTKDQQQRPPPPLSIPNRSTRFPRGDGLPMGSVKSKRDQVLPAALSYAEKSLQTLLGDKAYTFITEGDIPARLPFVVGVLENGARTPAL